MLLHLEHETTLQIGRLGSHQLEKSYYVYAERISQQLTGKARRRHIDYLRELAAVEGLWVRIGPPPQDCKVIAEVLRLPGDQPGPPGFGSSGCRCRTHLVYFGDRPDVESIARRLGLQKG